MFIQIFINIFLKAYVHSKLQKNVLQAYLKLPLASDCSSFPYATGLSNNAVCPVLFEIFLLILLQGCM